MRSLLSRVILFVSFSLSSLSICPATTFWLAEFLLKDQLLTLWGFPCMLFVVFPLLLLIFFFVFNFFFNLFMAMLGLRFCARAFSNCGKWGPLFIAVHGPLTIAASLVAELRLQTRRLSNCGSRA